MWQKSKSLQKAKKDKSRVSMSEVAKATSKHSLARSEHESKYGVHETVDRVPSCQRPGDTLHKRLRTFMTPELPSILVLCQ